MSYATSLRKAKCESVDTTIRKWRLLFSGRLQRTRDERLSHRVMLGMLAGGENPGPDRPEITGPKRLVDDFRVFRATEGSTETSPWCLE